jgi:cell division protein FtsL
VRATAEVIGSRTGKAGPPDARRWLAARSARECIGPLGRALILAIPVVLAALFLVWTRVTTVRLGYELSKAVEVHERLLEENRGLRVEVATLEAPSRLKRLARSEYGLEKPKSEQVIEIR